MKLGIIGYGYWGKILHKNLKNFSDVVIHDPYIGIDNEESINDCSHVFVATTTSTHKSVVDPLLQKGINVFCEKPLYTDKPSVNCLFAEAKKNNVNLFVDWTFTFNDAISAIKKMYENKELGSIRSVTMNRMNSGPVRHDVSAKWDLSSHDVSIIQYLFEDYPTDVHWIERKRNPKSFQHDTCIGILQYESFDVLINSSWEYSAKDRRCVFEFDAGILIWDDSTNTIKLNGKDIKFTTFNSPLENSISCFLEGGIDQEKLTTQVTEILEN